MLQFAEGRQRNWGRRIDQIVFLLVILASSDYEKKHNQDEMIIEVHLSLKIHFLKLSEFRGRHCG